jgi:hypothetical protein
MKKNTISMSQKNKMKIGHAIIFRIQNVSSLAARCSDEKKT